MFANKICFVFPDGLTNYFDLADVLIVYFFMLIPLSYDILLTPGIPECLVISVPSSKASIEGVDYYGNGNMQ